MKDIPYNFGWELVVFEGSTVYPLLKRTLPKLGNLVKILGLKMKSLSPLSTSLSLLSPVLLGCSLKRKQLLKQGLNPSILCVRRI